MTAPCNDCTLLSLHNAITTHPIRPPPYPGVNQKAEPRPPYRSYPPAAAEPTCDFPPLTTSNNHRTALAVLPGGKPKNAPAPHPPTRTWYPPLPLPGSPCTDATAPSCSTPTRTPTARCSECNLLSQHSAIVPTSSSSPSTRCTTTPSPATAHPPVYTNHRSRSLSDPAGKPPRPCPHQHQGRDPAPLLSVGDSGSRRLVAGCLNGWGSRALLMGSCCRGSARKAEGVAPG